jgi:hypothetical protein
VEKSRVSSNCRNSVCDINKNAIVERKLSEHDVREDVLSLILSAPRTGAKFPQRFSRLHIFRQLPRIYLAAPKEGNVEILRSMASAIRLDGGSIDILWEKLYSFFIEQQMLTLQKEMSGKVPTRLILLQREYSF